ncbi:MAG: prolyl aminopeptidase [Candidatus Protochlamydia sp.]|nr:prolyl aminopeptidase [Candidatus Protochlamydia sp.]
MVTIEPFATGYLPVGDGNEIYWEISGNPKGKPALYLHGGPGSGISNGYRRHFDPKTFLIVSFEQRGCGRSRPRVTDSGIDLMTNTTQALLSDIEKLRIHLNVDKWLLLGISWGTTLALAYGQAYPKRVSAIVLAAVTTTTSAEVKWVTEDMRRVFPREWEKFAAAVHPENEERIIDAYYRQITSTDLKIRETTSRAWCAWEDVHVSFDPLYKPNPRFQDLEFSLPFSILTIHYWKHSAFLRYPGILENISRISHLPCVLIHGQLDISSPLEIPWKLHKAWSGSELKVIDNEGHGGTFMSKEITTAINKISL